jgi:hypothetical protein
MNNIYTKKAKNNASTKTTRTKIQLGPLQLGDTKHKKASSLVGIYQPDKKIDSPNSKTS